jgi:hypothetical protein
MSRGLERRKMGSAVGDQCSLLKSGAWCAPEEGHYDLAPSVVWDADDRSFGDVRVFKEYVFDLGGE